MTAVFDPIALVRVLAEHDVDCVLIGGLAAVLHGSPTTTNDADIVPEMSAANLERVGAALRALDARLRVASDPDGVPFDPHPALLASMKMLNTTTRYGDLDLTISPAGIDNYESLTRAAVTFDIDGSSILVASLDDLIRSKESADRAKDHATLPLLHALRDEIEQAG
ncbi:MAG: hypothetical protein ABIP17_08600 [Ilumatobacteraceae bacterium]